MAVFHPHTVKCLCGQTLTVLLADSINVKRSPEARERILRGELHRASCPACKRQMTVEKPFYYTDLTRNAFFKVFPRGERHTWKKASNDLDAASNLVPGTIAATTGRTLRVLFGMDELREKLIAQDANIDDRIVELLKVLVVHEHPVLLRRARLRLILDNVKKDTFEFTAAYEHHQQRFRVAIPRERVESVAARTEQLKAWVKGAHQTENIFEEPDHWVNMWRWSPQPSALDRLKAYAAQIRAGTAITTTTAAFKQMLVGLPRGNHLPPWAKQDLRTLFEYAKAKKLQTLQDQLFEIRFGIELEDDWSMNNDPEDIDTLWKLLKDLPDTSVEGNTKIHEILLSEGEGGGLYNPETFDISIGSDELTNREKFEDVMRHEVGHAVHEQKSDLINDWLASRFGWRIFGANDADIDRWVGLMGGWGTLTPVQRTDVRQYLRTALGGGTSWQPGPPPAAPAGHPWYGATFGPRLAFERSGPYWFQNYKSWYRRGTRAFFLNFWYRTLMAVDTKTLDLVAKMPDAYASMSHFEFFAELFALYYDLDDPKRSVIPANVSKWIAANLGAVETGAPIAAASRAKREWETIVRPRRRSKKR
jgi:hypothetical protein